MEVNGTGILAFGKIDLLTEVHATIHIYQLQHSLAVSLDSVTHLPTTGLAVLMFGRGCRSLY
jgi:hypothetical protein